MKRVSNMWKQYLSEHKEHERLFDEFALRAKTAAAEIVRVKSVAEANAALAKIVQEASAKKVVLVESELCDRNSLKIALDDEQVKIFCSQTDIAKNAPDADVGISMMEFCIAETGSVCQDAISIESRLVSTLPAIHIALVYADHIVDNVNQAMDVIAHNFNHGYVSFITGPSRTADIERVLTIGVHGPSRFILIALEQSEER